MANRPTDRLGDDRRHVAELLRRNRHDLAERVVRQVLAVEPDDPQAVRQLASCLSARFALDEALVQGRRAVALAPRSAAAFLTLALVHDRLGDQDSAIACCQEALRLRPDDTAAMSHLADLCLQGKRQAESLVWTAAGLAVDPAHPGLLRNRARALAWLGRADEAIATIGELLRLDPGGALTHAGVGMAYKSLRRFDEAADHLLRALSIDPLHPELHTQLGYVRLGQGRLAEAERHFADALRLHPDRGSAATGRRKVEARPLWDRAKAARAAGDHAGAERSLLDLLAVDPTNHLARAELARALLFLGRHDEAVGTATEAVSASPGSPMCRHILGRILLAAEQFQAALEQGEESVRLKPGGSLFYRVPAEALVEMGRHAEALVVLERGMAIKPHVATLPALRAVAMAGVGRDAEAVAAADDIVSRRPDDTELCRLAGQAHLSLGRFVEAQALFERSLTPEPLWGRTGHLGLGLAFVGQGDRGRARSHLEEAARLNPLSRRAREAIALMDGGS